MKRAGLVVVLVLVAAVVLVALAGCESEDLAAARRAEAAADRERAAAEAYEARIQADTQAAAERSAIREAERNASHERSIELLPYAAGIGGGVLVVVLVLFVAWDLRRQPPRPSTDPALLLLLDAQRRQLADLERATYHAIVAEQRRRLAEASGPVTIYQDSGPSLNG